MKFEELNLPSFIIDALKANNITEMTEIQEKSIPTLIEKKDLIGQSRTGSGKTFAYGIPSIVNLEQRS
jgi:superfamily II DNA/RNA helicase